MTRDNVKTQETTRRRQKRKPLYKCIRVESAQCKGKVHGAEPCGSNFQNIQRGDTAGRTNEISGRSSTGKILERLQAIQNDYERAYNEQIEILESLLVTIKSRKAAFDQATKELERDIYNIITEESK